MKPEYTLTVSKDQLTVINIALEQYFRTHMGQFFDFADSLSELNKSCAWSKNEERFSEWIARRDLCKEMCEHAWRVAIGKPYLDRQTNEMMLAQDVWQVIRYKLAEDRGVDGEELNWIKPLFRVESCKIEKVKK